MIGNSNHYSKPNPYPKKNLSVQILDLSDINMKDLYNFQKNRNLTSIFSNMLSHVFLH